MGVSGGEKIANCKSQNLDLCFCILSFVLVSVKEVTHGE